MNVGLVKPVIVAQSKPILFLSLVTILALCAPVVTGYLKDLIRIDVRYITIEGTTSDGQIDALNNRLVLLDPDFSTIDEIKTGLEELSWVQSADVRKIWPDRMDITVKEQIPLARWNNGEFLNGDGVIFQSSYIDSVKVPLLEGPPGAERLVMWHFQKLNGVVGSAGKTIESLRLSDRGSWSFDFEGVSVRLGKEDILERTRRFLRVYKDVGFSENLADIAEIDTRYPNGMAVSWIKGACQSDCYANNINLKRDIEL